MKFSSFRYSALGQAVKDALSSTISWSITPGNDQTSNASTSLRGSQERLMLLREEKSVVLTSSSIQGICIDTDTVWLPGKRKLLSSGTLHGKKGLCYSQGWMLLRRTWMKPGHELKNIKECLCLFQKKDIFAALLVFLNKQTKDFYLLYERQTGKNLFILTAKFYRWSEVGGSILTSWSLSSFRAGKILYLPCLIWMTL